ncbi:MAG: acylphosphatase [bacterium]|nr:acylphosphatase [bacterium]
MKQKEILCRITGRVQMVMYRDFAKRNARRLHLVGTVQNMPDGSVRVEAEGREEDLRAFIEILKKGPLLSSVEHVAVAWNEPQGNYSDFRIVY